MTLNMERPIIALTIIVTLSGSVFSAEGRFVIRKVTGHPETVIFDRPGWVGVFHRGYGQGVGSRIGADGTFEIPEVAKRPVTLIAMFDAIETPPIVVPDFSPEDGVEVLIPTEYSCVPTGYPEVDTGEFQPVTARGLIQILVPTADNLYGITLFDGPPPAEWGNQIHIGLYAGKIEHAPIPLVDQIPPDPYFDDGIIDRVTSNKAANEMLRAGWRHGNMPVVPGWKYLALVEGYRSHSGKQFECNAYMRSEDGNGYPDGQAVLDGEPADGDLCFLVFGNSHGQNVENQIRSEEWEVFLPVHRPSRDWGQTFISHGKSLAGISFWASAGEEKSVACEVRIREQGPWGKMLKPAKVARGCEVTGRPVIRYPDTPIALPGYESFHEEPHLLFQVAYHPDELALEPGKTYYIEVIPTSPVMMYVDGDYYQEGYAYYEGLKMEKAIGGRTTKHSRRWTLAMNIVTYAKEGGAPLSIPEE